MISIANKPAHFVSLTWRLIRNFRGRYKTVFRQIWALRWRRWKIIFSLKYNKANRSFYFMFCLLIKGKIFEIELNKN